jgi:hypothetical protein
MAEMTREEYIDFANALKNNYTIDFDKLPEFRDMAISALSANGEYVKKSDILNELGDVNMDILTDEVKEIVNGLPSYSFPDSADIEKIQTEILEKMADYVASGYANSAEDFEEYSRIVIQTFNEHIGGKDK